MEEMDRNRRRKFGQNFLNNPALVRDIARDLPAQAGDWVLEIGPGHGALTEMLLERGLRVLAIDVDSECVELLNHKLGGENFSARHQDFMETDLEEFADRGMWVAGNLPYNVGTAIVTKLMPELHRFRGGMFMLQKEVIVRMASPAGSRDYGSLSVFCRGHADVKILRDVAPENFTPKPNVMSATALWLPLSSAKRLPEEFYPFAQMAFRQKRKTLTNNLGDHYTKPRVIEALGLLGMDPAVRAEALEPEDLFRLWCELEPLQAS
jgi:16S rRNA (adenine1518-N6/adenine1519-N6)-dimethyltransferase